MSNVEDWGIAFADVIIRSAHMRFAAQQGRKMVSVVIEQLQKRIDEIQPKKATPEYYRARYEKEQGA